MSLFLWLGRYVFRSFLSYFVLAVQVFLCFVRPCVLSLVRGFGRYVCRKLFRFGGSGISLFRSSVRSVFSSLWCYLCVFVISLVRSFVSYFGMSLCRHFVRSLFLSLFLD